MASFGYGWPKLLSPQLDKESSSLDIDTFFPQLLVIDEHRSKLAVLYDDKVVFWSTGRVRVVIGKLWPNCSKGRIQGGCFRYDGKRFAVIFEKKCLLIYKLEPFHPPPGRSSWFDFVSSSQGNIQEKDSHSWTGCKEEYILPTILTENEVGTGEEEYLVTCTSCPLGVIVVTSTLEMYCVSWEGEMFWHTPIAQLFSSDWSFMDRTNGVVSIDYHKATDLCGLVLDVSGIAFIVKIHEGGRIPPEMDDTIILREHGASCIALETQQCHAAVGLTNGSVEIYNTNVFVTGQPVCLRTLSLDSLYLSVSDIGRVVSVEWTSDGNCVAVGYEKTGVVVWSPLGYCLFCSFSSLEQPSTGGENHVVESSRHGYLFGHVKDICWGLFGYSLFVLGSVEEYDKSRWETADSKTPFCLVELGFLKTGFSKGSCQNEATRRFLLGPDFFVVVQDNALTNYPHMYSLKQKLLQHVEVPYEYVSNNWPLRLLSCNDDKNFVAVSGKHGVALYNIRSKRWRLFGDVVEEKMIQSSSLCWYRNSIIIGNEIAIQKRKTCRYELLIFPRDGLNFSFVQAQIPLQGAPLLLDARKDGYVLVFADDLQLRLFQLKSQGSKYTYSTLWSFHITVEAPLASPRRITKGRSTGTFVSSVRIYPPCLLSGERDNAPQQVLLLKSTGSLILLDIPKGISIPILRMVHAFWFHNPDCFPIETRNSPSSNPYVAIWAVAEDGIYCSFDSNMSADTSQSPSTMISRFVSYKWFQVDMNVYPLGFVEYGGFLTGISSLQTAGMSLALGNMHCRLPCFGIQIERQELMSKFFLRWLADDTLEEMQCFKWIASCSKAQHFENALERCLYELLGRVQQQQQQPSVSFTTNDSVELVDSSCFPINQATFALERFMRLVKYFGEYEDVIVGCARKMDYKYWNSLFSYVGEPCLLFENCCLTHRLTVAAGLLKIIQEWWDLQVAVMHAWRLLQCCLNRGRIDIAEQVVAFLDRAGGEGFVFSVPEWEMREEEKRLWEKGIVRRTTTTASTNQHLNMVDAILLQHLGACLEKMQWKQAVNMSMCFGISLADYWQAQTTISYLQQPFFKVLLCLHDSFQWPFPSVDIVEKRWSRSNLHDAWNTIGASEDNEQLQQVIDRLSTWQNKNTWDIENESWSNKQNNIKYYRLVRQQLQYLVGNAAVARQWEVVVGGLTALLQCEELRVVLKNLHTDWLAWYRDGLEKSQVAGYVWLSAQWEDITTLGG